MPSLSVPTCHKTLAPTEDFELVDPSIASQSASLPQGTACRNPPSPSYGAGKLRVPSAACRGPPGLAASGENENA